MTADQVINSLEWSTPTRVTAEIERHFPEIARAIRDVRYAEKVLEGLLLLARKETSYD